MTTTGQNCLVDARPARNRRRVGPIPTQPFQMVGCWDVTLGSSWISDRQSACEWLRSERSILLLKVANSNHFDFWKSC